MEKPSHVQVVQNEQRQIARSDIARNIRATDDISSQIQQRREYLHQQLTTTRSLDVLEITRQREELFTLEEQLQHFSKKMVSNSVPSTAATNDYERKEIKGLYESGLYTQLQIARQYGITQSAVSQIVNS